jgi:hypothetical protein
MRIVTMRVTSVVHSSRVLLYGRSDLAMSNNEREAELQSMVRRCLECL